jgi:AcrR family transcriptional regulator
MPSPARSRPRPYLAFPERRLQLLEAASTRVRSGGWNALSMQGLASAAGVSRQLVYEHFATVADLHQALLLHLFEPAYEATRAVVRSGRDVPDVLREAYELFFEMPPDQRRALRALATSDEPTRPDLARAKKLLRRRISDLWAPYVAHATGLREADAVALVWTLLMGAWGLADMVADRVVDRPRAVALFVGLASQALSSARLSRRRERSPMASGRQPRRPHHSRRSPDA